MLPIPAQSCLPLRLPLSKLLGAKLIRQTTDLTHCCSLIHLPLPTEKIYLIYHVKIFQPKEFFPISSSLASISASIYDSQGKIAEWISITQVSMICWIIHPWFPFYFLQVLRIMMEIRIEQFLYDKTQYDKIVLQYIKDSITHFKQMHFKVF